MKKEIEFNESDLVGSMREALAHAQGKLTLKTTKVPRRTRAMSPAAITRIRRLLKASTPVFAAYLNVTPDTVRTGKRIAGSHPARRCAFCRLRRSSLKSCSLRRSRKSG